MRRPAPSGSDGGVFGLGELDPPSYVPKASPNGNSPAVDAIITIVAVDAPGAVPAVRAAHAVSRIVDRAAVAATRTPPHGVAVSTSDAA
jgi:hypothetical protein